MSPLGASLLAVSEFWGGDGKTWLAVIAVIVFIALPLFALYHARTFIRKL
jgi:hypothetical protein